MVSSQDKNHKKKLLAEESHKTKRAREKLEKRLKTMDAKLTKEALEKKAVEIQHWISRHSNSRVSLKNKSISLFDENQNAAEISLRVAKIAEKLTK